MCSELYLQRNVETGRECHGLGSRPKLMISWLQWKERK